MTAQTDTPLTDRHVYNIGADGMADGDFARQLETRLAKSEQALAVANAKLNKEIGLCAQQSTLIEAYTKEGVKQRQELKRAEHEREEAMKDAGRYRWLRGQVTHDFMLPPIAQVVWKRGNDPHGIWMNLVNGDELDEKVDAAISEGGHHD